MSLPTPEQTPVESLLSPAMWGLIGIAVTKVIDLIVARSKGITSQTARFTEAQQTALEGERTNRIDRESQLVEEITMLTAALRLAREELQSARVEIVNEQRTSLKWERRVAQLELDLQKAGIPLTHAEAGTVSPASFLP